MEAFSYYTKVLKNYVGFDGRARRAEYWYFVLVTVIISIVLSFISDLVANIYALATLVPSIAVAIRRMHDINKSGWYILIPIYNLVLAATAGDKGSNQYGPDPKSPAADIADHLVS